MDEKSQIIYMQTRLVRLASEQWRRPYHEVVKLFKDKGVFRYIAKMWELFHIEGDFAVLDDVSQYLKAKGVADA
ncbi:MAG: DUF3791 domain-containing protein [Fibrobacter sp.]|nr:DUF3791 domain-containing protein [Fibrobacter sp.]